MNGGNGDSPAGGSEVSIEFALAYARLNDHGQAGQKAIWGPLDEAVLRSLQGEIFRLRQLVRTEGKV